MGRCLPILAVAIVAGCATEVDLRGRPCADQTCLPGFTCDTIADRCVGTGDACDTEADLLPCEPGDSACAEGCRVCHDGAWGDCVTPDKPVAPSLNGVTDLCAGADATVTWDTAENVTYEIAFWDTAAWVTPDFEGNGTATQNSPAPGVNYQWQITATNAVGSSVNTSPLFQVTAIPTNPLLPLVDDLCTGVPAIISWTTRPLETYTVQFWDGAAWIEPESVLSNNASTTPGDGSGYKWRIATSVGQCTADWTETSNTFAVRAPKTLTQVRVTTNAAPVVNASWALSSGCTSSVEVQRDLTPPMSVTDGDPVTATAIGFADTSVTPGVVYYYRAFINPLAAPTVTGPLMCALVPTVSIHPVHLAVGAITIDGVAEAAWDESAALPFTPSQVFGESGGADDRIGASMRFAWDDDAFYFMITIEDKYVYVDSGTSTWLDDAIELYFDMGFERSSTPDTNDFHFVLVADDSSVYAERGTGVAWDDTYVADFSRAVVVDGTINDNSDVDNEWAIEGRIPFSMLGNPTMTTTPPPTIGFAVWIDEDDTLNHDQQHSYKWMENSLYENPSTWGIAQF